MENIDASSSKSFKVWTDIKFDYCYTLYYDTSAQGQFIPIFYSLFKAKLCAWPETHYATRKHLRLIFSPYSQHQSIKECV